MDMSNQSNYHCNKFSQIAFNDLSTKEEQLKYLESVKKGSLRQDRNLD